MRLVQIVGLVVRVFAVFLVVNNLFYAARVIDYAMSKPDHYIAMALNLVLAFVPTFVAIFLWFFPLAVATKLIPDVGNASVQAPMGAEELEVVAYSVVGLWVLTAALPDALYWAVLYYRAKADPAMSPNLPPASIAAMLLTGGKLVLGIWLMLGSRGLVGLIRRIRYAGT